MLDAANLSFLMMLQTCFKKGKILNVRTILLVYQWAQLLSTVGSVAVYDFSVNNK